MSTVTTRPRDVADVDYLVDENGNPVEVANDTALKLETDVEQTVGMTGPTAWWRMGLLALFAIAAVLLALQLLGGNAGTDVIPGTPVTGPQTTVPVPTSK
jgi:hypothetical protein